MEGERQAGVPGRSESAHAYGRCEHGGRWMAIGWRWAGDWVALGERLTSSTRQTSHSSAIEVSRSSRSTSCVSGARSAPVPRNASPHRDAESSSRKQTIESEPLSIMEKYWASAVPASCTRTPAKGGTRHQA